MSTSEPDDWDAVTKLIEPFVATCSDGSRLAIAFRLLQESGDFADKQIDAIGALCAGLIDTARLPPAEHDGAPADYDASQQETAECFVERKTGQLAFWDWDEGMQRRGGSWIHLTGIGDEEAPVHVWSSVRHRLAPYLGVRGPGRQSRIALATIENSGFSVAQALVLDELLSALVKAIWAGARVRQTPPADRQPARGDPGTAASGTERPEFPSEDVEPDVGERFDPLAIKEARERVVAVIVQRRGQPTFREQLIKAYGGRCAVTGCDVEESLEAAHIVPYQGSDTNIVSNGLLLRADVHTLFDLGLLGVDVETMTIVLAAHLVGSAYGALAGAQLRLPDNPALRPSRKALQWHRAHAGL
ncbi:MAG: HNH endonuclease [Armatimonadetes bacterium]|nr:HNH endonuclease [Armatimonadota bacterium]